MRTAWIVMLLMFALLVILWVGAYNDMGPLKFVGGYPGFPEAGSPMSINPSSAQEV